MKKLLILCISVLFTNFLMAQQATISFDSPLSVEVGIPYYFTFRFNPDYSSSYIPNVLPDSFVITEWIVIVPTIGSGGGMASGYVGNPNNQSAYFYDGTYNNSATYTIPIQWGDGTFTRNSDITVKISGFYRKASTGQVTGYFNYQPQTTKSIIVERVFEPKVSGNTRILDCNQTISNYSITNMTYGDKYLWTATNGATIIGSNTSTSADVKPSLSGNYDVKCKVSRISGNPNYYKETSVSVTRKPRALSLTSSNATYICTGGSRIIQTDNQIGITSVNWFGTNCTISPEAIVNGKRQVTVTANANVPTGYNITVNATANFNGGCTANASLAIPVGTPKPSMENLSCNTTSNDAPCYLSGVNSYYNYLSFWLKYDNGFVDWEWEKLSGNFVFSNNGNYNSSTASGRFGQLYITGANPVDAPLQFRCRVITECGTGQWKTFIWNDGTLSPPPPPPTPVKYFTVYPNPTNFNDYGGYVSINLLNNNNSTSGSTQKDVTITSMYGGQIVNTFFYGNQTSINMGYQPAGTYFINISFGGYSENHILIVN